MEKDNDRYSAWTIGAFRAWLDRYTEDAVCGYAGRSCDCPLTRWRIACGDTGVLVGRIGVVTDAYERDHDPWAERLVELIDAYGMGAGMIAGVVRGLVAQVVADDSDQTIPEES